MNQVIPFPADGLRQAPANIEAERGLLGTLLMRNGTFDAVSDFLRPEHFSDAAHAELFRAIADLISSGKKADPVTLKILAEAGGPVQAAGGVKYIAALMSSAPTLINAGEYGQVIFDAFLRRELIELSANATLNAYDGEQEATRQIEFMEEKLFALTETQASSNLLGFADATTSAIDTAEAAYKADGALIGVTTGIHDLDRKLGGLHKSDLIILAGRPSMGKSGLAMSMAVGAAKAGKSVAVFSLEMSADQVANRALARFSGLNSHDIRNGRLSAADFAKLYQAREKLSAIPLHIDDRSSPSVPQIRTAARRLKRKSGLDLIIIDYLQLIMPSRAGREENRVQEVSAISRGLKMIAKDLGVPVVALSQLSRKVEEREDKRPQLSDLRESGSIEQDADVVMFVYRDEYYQTRSGGICPAELENVAEVNVAKQRHGPIGQTRCHFDHKSAWFSDLAVGHGR